MRYQLLGRAALVSGLLLGGLLGPVPGVAADDDEVKANVRFLRCYDGAEATYYGALVLWEGPELRNVAYGLVLAGRERGGQDWGGLHIDHGQAGVPFASFIDSRTGGHLRSVRLALGGADTRQAELFRADEEADCSEVGDREGLQVKVALACYRETINDQVSTAFAVLTDLINHGSQTVQGIEVRHALEVQYRGLSGFEDIAQPPVFLEGVASRGAALDAKSYGGPGFNQARKVRAEVEVHVAGRSQPIREDAEADCPGGN